MDPLRESEMEMGLIDEGPKEPRIDSHLEQGSNEETKLVMSSNVPDKGVSSNTARLSASWVSVLTAKQAAKKFQRRGNRRQGAETSYEPLDNHDQDETQESCGQAGIQVIGEQIENQEKRGQPEIEGSPGQPEIEGSPGQPEIEGSPGQPEIEGRPGQPEIEGSPGQPEIEGSPGQRGIEGRPGQPEIEGSREEFGETSRSSIRMKHKVLISQFNSYAVLLVLVAGVMSVAILQPPGSFDSNGRVRKVAWNYLLFASESFLIAMIGLFTVMFGFISLSNPVFCEPPRTSDAFNGSATSKEIEIINANISRLSRVGFYLSASLFNCYSAFCFGLRAVVYGTPFVVIVIVLFVVSLIFIHLEVTTPLWTMYCSTKIKELIRGLRRPT